MTAVEISYERSWDVYMHAQTLGPDGRLRVLIGHAARHGRRFVVLLRANDWRTA